MDAQTYQQLMQRRLMPEPPPAQGVSPEDMLAFIQRNRAEEEAKRGMEGMDAISQRMSRGQSPYPPAQVQVPAQGLGANVADALLPIEQRIQSAYQALPSVPNIGAILRERARALIEGKGRGL